MILPEPSPRYLPVNMPFPNWSAEYTVAVLDKDGNVTIRTLYENPLETSVEEPAEEKPSYNFENFVTYKRRDGMSYLSVNREQLITDLKQTVAEIRFQKKDGSTRVMNCTLMRQYLPEEFQQKQEEAANRDHNPDVLAVWDVDANAWRSFRLEWVYSIQQKDTI